MVVNRAQFQPLYQYVYDVEYFTIYWGVDTYIHCTSNNIKLLHSLYTLMNSVTGFFICSNILKQLFTKKIWYVYVSHCITCLLRHCWYLSERDRYFQILIIFYWNLLLGDVFNYLSPCIQFSLQKRPPGSVQVYPTWGDVARRHLPTFRR